MTKRVISDYSNQLDLLPEAVEEKPTPISDARLESQSFKADRECPSRCAFSICCRWRPPAAPKGTFLCQDVERRPPRLRETEIEITADKGERQWLHTLTFRKTSGSSASSIAFSQVFAK
jgi:hypothetical protein